MGRGGNSDIFSRIPFTLKKTLKTVLIFKHKIGHFVQNSRYFIELSLEGTIIQIELERRLLYEKISY